MRASFAGTFLLLLLGASAALSVPAAAQIVLDGEVPDDGSDFALVPFTVPEGTVEIEVRHDDLSEANILDWGLLDASGAFRGWGGGNAEPAIVGVEAASRSYRAGPIEAGEWALVIGKARIADAPAPYHVEIDVRTTATLTPMPERAPYAPVAALSTGPRWYAGDFHVHSRESGDAQPSIDEVATFARSRGLDFVLLSEHNTDAHVSLIADAQARHPELLLMPGVEYTTYRGHANGIGVTTYVSHLLGVDGFTIEDAIAAIHDQGALFSINHPVLDLGDRCIGCAWDHDVSPSEIDAVEIETGGYRQTGHLFTRDAIAFWDGLLEGGAHIAAIGGSDDHRAGTGTGTFDSPIGDPVTMVYAEELSVAGIVEGVRRGRTVVRLQGPDDPTLVLRAGEAMLGDTVDATRVTLRAEVEGGVGTSVRFVRNGMPLDAVPVDADPFELALEVDAPYGDAEDRWRAELVEGRDLRVVTSHVYVSPQEGTPPPDAGTGEPEPEGGCGCRVTSRGSAPMWALALALALSLRRRR